ncbi:MAG: beta-galactosidase [Fimbriimonas sp.]
MANTRKTLIPGESRILHGGDYNPDQWLKQPEILDEDFRLMPLAGCNTFSVGIFAWVQHEPQEGVFQFEWLDRLLDRFAEAGHRAIVATPSGAKPAWMSEKYPEIRRVNRAGIRDHYKERHNHCWTSPIYREKVRIINTHLAERYAGHPALGMWHISNEYGGECFCDLCLTSFRSWLRDRYQTLDALNEAWWTGFWSHTYTDWSQIEPGDWSVDGLELDWKRFVTEQVCDFFEWEVQPMRALTPEIPCTTNYMGLYSGIDYARLAQHLDVVVDDQYPRFNPLDAGWARSAAGISMKDSLHRNFKPDRPWMVMESCPDSVQWMNPMTLKRPGVHRIEMLQAIGHGAEGTLYFQWRKGRGGGEKLHGAVVDHVGHENTRVFRTVAEVGELYKKLGGVIGSTVPADVALLYDWDNRWAFELTSGAPTNHGEFGSTVHDHYQALWERQIAVDVISANADGFSAYKVVVAPILWLIHPGVADRLKDYVSRGGILVATFYCGTVDSTNRVWFGGLPGDGLRELFGVWNEETDVLHPEASAPLQIVDGNSLGLSDTLTARTIRSILHLEGAEAVATYTDQFYAGTPAVTVNSFGLGKAIYFGVQSDVASIGHLYDRVLPVAGVAPVVNLEAPVGVSAQLRTSETHDYLFIQNFTAADAPYTLHEDGFTNVETGETVQSGVLKREGSLVLVRTK